VPTVDFDVGFVAGLKFIDGSFVFEVEAVAVISGHFAVVEDGLIGEMDFKDFTKQVSCFAGGDSERDVKGEDERQGIEGVSDGRDIFARSGGGVGELLGGEVVFAELVTQLELGRFEGAEEPFGEVEFA